MPRAWPPPPAFVRSTPRSTGSMVRTTKGMATSAWPMGTIHQVAAPVDRIRVERDQHAEADRDRRRGDRQHERRVEQPAARPGSGDRQRGQRADDQGDDHGDRHERSDVSSAATGSTPMADARPHLDRPEVAPSGERVAAAGAQRTLDERDHRQSDDDRRDAQRWCRRAGVADRAAVLGAACRQ